MTRIIVTGHGRISLALAAALLDRGDFVEVGTGSITTQVNEPDLPAFNLPEPAHISPTSSAGRRVAQWKAERKGRRS